MRWLKMTKVDGKLWQMRPDINALLVPHTYPSYRKPVAQRIQAGPAAPSLVWIPKPLTSFWKVSFKAL
jgi:hypothetical protein